MDMVVRWVCGAALLVVAGFCVFGLLAAFEPGADPWHVFKLGYAAITFGCVGLTGRLALAAYKKKPALQSSLGNSG